MVERRQMPDRRDAPSISFLESSKVKLEVHLLEPGMYVAELDRPWDEAPFLFQGFHLEDQDDVKAVQELCSYVYVDTSRRVKVKVVPRTITRGESKSHHTIRSVPVEHEYTTAKAAFEQSGKLIKTIMDDIRLGKSVDTKAAKEAVAGCVDSVMRNPDALLLFTGIKNKDDYTSEHSLNVSILSISFGRTMGMEREALIELGTCGLLHDVGKIITPIEVLNKPGALTAKEYEVMKQHTDHGRDILMGSDGVGMAALEVAYGHHEHMDGTGYPRGLTEDSLTQYTKMVGITDAFDAITSDRVYINGRTIMEAFRILDKHRGTHFDPKYVMNFIKSVGMFPPGSVVELSTGEIGVVIETHHKMKLRPKVLVVKNPTLPIETPEYILDLAMTHSTPDGKKINVIRMVHPKDVGVDIGKMKDAGYFKKAMIQTAEQQAG